MSTRNPGDMCDELYDKWVEWVRAMRNGLRLDYVLTRVACTYQEQVALYAQGRESLRNVNAYRKLAGLPPIQEFENKKVTWTLKSRHIINLEDQDTTNNKARAFDFAILAPSDTAENERSPTWDIKVDTNKSNTPDYYEAGRLWESLGGEWGGRWKNPDRPHCQLRE